MTPLLKLKLRMSNWEKLKQRLVKMVTGYFRGEGEQEEIYGRTFFDAITADPAYKDKYIHAVGLVGELAGKYGPFEKIPLHSSRERCCCYCRIRTFLPRRIRRDWLRQ